MAIIDFLETWLALIERSFWGLFIALETMRIVEELIEIWPNEVYDTILEKPWVHISADFITKLPLAQGYNSILVVVNWLTKMVHFIPTMEKTSAEGLARLFRDNVWKLHGLPESIILDRGLQFAAELMWELNRMLGIKSKLSTVFHPQIDEQTERVNQELEQYLRMFIDHRQEQ